MEHPLIPNLDSLTTQQLTDKLSELNKKLAIAYRSGNSYLCDQLRMAIESYNTKYQERLNNSEKTPFSEVIDIK